MVSPRGNGQVNDFGIGVVASKESSSNSESSSPRDGLGDDNLKGEV